MHHAKDDALMIDDMHHAEDDALMNRRMNMHR
jgi:hypothetical protein